MTQPDIIQGILNDSKYRFTLFNEGEIAALRRRVALKSHRGKETPYVKCLVRDKDIQLNDLTPES